MPRVGRLLLLFGLALLPGACASGAEPPPQTPVERTAARLEQGPATAQPVRRAPGATASRPSRVSRHALFDALVPRSSFPSPSAGNLGCSGQAISTGDHARDYESLAAACGAPTGLREYTKPFTAKLHYVHDQRDEYRVIFGGFCFRVLAASDSTVFDLGVRLLGPEWRLIAADATASPPAIAGVEPSVSRRTATTGWSSS